MPDMVAPDRANVNRADIVRCRRPSTPGPTTSGPSHEGVLMPINPNAIGEKTDPYVFEWTDRETLLYAIGVGAGLDDLAFTTENSHEIEQQVLPTYAVIACSSFGAAAKIGTFTFGMLLHGSQEIRVAKPLPPAGKLRVVAEVADIQDKGQGK